MEKVKALRCKECDKEYPPTKLYVNGRNIRFLNQLNTNTKLNQDDEVTILPSVSGG